jgi:hypothetical protein
MMVTVFLWTNNINVPCKPPTHVFEGKVRQKKWGQYTSKYDMYADVSEVCTTCIIKVMSCPDDGAVYSSETLVYLYETTQKPGISTFAAVRT